MQRILIVNDDGYDAPGLKAAALALAEDAAFEVRVCAPAKDESGRSHAITVHETIRASAHTYHEDDGVEGLDADAAAAAKGVLRQRVRCVRHTGTPVDSVRVAEHIFEDFTPHLVVSGINRGNNAARNVIYSGTVGAAREAWLHGVGAVAASLDYPATYPSRADTWHYRAAALTLRDVVHDELARLAAGGAAPRCLNLNVPNCVRADMRALVRDARVGNSGFIGHLRRVDGAHGEATGDTVLAATGRFHLVDAADDASLDVVALKRGHPTLSVLHSYDASEPTAAHVLAPHALYEWSTWTRQKEEQEKGMPL